MREICHGIWPEIAGEIKRHLSVDAFQRWFAAIELVGADEVALTFQVPNIIYQYWIESNYLNLLQAAVMSALGGPREIKFLAADCGINNDSAPDSVPGPVKRATSVPVDPEDDLEGALFRGMNPRHKFEAFVVGSSNQFAHAAAMAVSQSPVKTFNPLFIFGGVGLGKTHLMQAIGQQAIERKKTQKVLYLSSERFTNEFIDAIQHNMLVRFRRRYRQSDVLLIDDVQFLAGKERSQEEFFHTFNTLFDGRKQIVLSSDRPPSEIANLEKRLVSRLECGLTTELQPPDLETRLAILRRKAAASQPKPAEELLAYLAQHIRTNVRRLEGALTRVTAYQSLNGGECSQETAEQLLRDILRGETKTPLTVDGILKQVAERFGIRLADMTGKGRSANVVFPRQIAMYLARQHTKASAQEIGEVFGGRHHGTVLHACNTVSKRIKNDDQIRHTMMGLATQLDRSAAQ